MLKVKLMLENGEEFITFLNDEEVKILENEVKEQNEFLRERDREQNYSLLRELNYAIKMYILGIKQKEKMGEVSHEQT